MASNSQQQITLTDFLLARIDEDREGLCDEPCHEDDASMRFALAECEAKQRIVEEAVLWGCQKTMCKILALPYADHADYREEWRP